MSNITNLKIFDYDKTVKDDNHIVFLSSEFCGPCKEILKKIEETNFDKHVYKIVIDTDDDDELEESFTLFNMTKVPTIIIYNNGKELDRYIGSNKCLEKFHSIFTSEIVEDEDF